jgi:hypothetical protein
LAASCLRIEQEILLSIKFLKRDFPCFSLPLAALPLDFDFAAVLLRESSRRLDARMPDRSLTGRAGYGD